MADALAQRMFAQQVVNHARTARSALRDLRSYVDQIDVEDPAIGAGHARNAASTLVELGQALAALQTLSDVGFLMEEKTND